MRRVNGCREHSGNVQHMARGSRTARRALMYSKVVSFSSFIHISLIFQRPFKCSHPGCDQSYMRESHLSAHMRTHLSPNTKAHACPVSECSKRFWTTQHVRRHVALCHAGSDVEGGTGEGGRAGAEDLLSTAGEGTDAELNRERERAYKVSLHVR